MRKLMIPMASALALSLSLAATVPAGASSYAGHWNVEFTARCADSPKNASLCRFVLGHFPAIGKTGTMIVEAGYDQITVASNNTYTDTNAQTLTEIAPGAKLTGCPPAAKLSTTNFNGSCAVTARGKGHILMKRGTPIFYADSVTITLQGKVIGTEKGASANTGLPTPAKAGIYNSAWAARQDESSKVPAGFSFQAVITHS